MVLLGAVRRLRRLGSSGRRFFLVALDHGLPAGPLVGIERPAELVRRLGGAPYTGVIVNPGIVHHVAAGLPPDRALVIHLSGGTLLSPRTTSKVLISSAECAVALGADAVSVQVNFGDGTEDRMLSDAGRVVDAAHGLGTPVLGMAHSSSLAGVSSTEAGSAAHAARAMAELGADLVQVSYAGSSEGFRQIVHGCPAPVLVAGGPGTTSETRWLEFLGEAIGSGAAGVSVGRILFQAAEPERLAERIAAVLRGERAGPIPVSEAVP